MTDRLDMVQMPVDAGRPCAVSRAARATFLLGSKAALTPVLFGREEALAFYAIIPNASTIPQALPETDDTARVA